MDLILGNQQVRQALEQGLPMKEIERGWQEGLQKFLDMRRKYLLY